MLMSRKCLTVVTNFNSGRLLCVSTSAVRVYAIQNNTIVTWTNFSKRCQETRMRVKFFNSFSFQRPLSKNEENKMNALNLPPESKGEAGNGVEIPPEQHYAYIQSITDRLHYIEESLRIRGHSVLRWGLGLVISVVLAVYMFREPLKENVADEIADVASRSLADDGVINNVNEMTKAVLQDIVNNSETTKLASRFVMNVLSHEDVKQATLTLAYDILSDPGTQEHVNKIAMQTFTQLLQSDTVRKTVSEFLKTLILDSSTKATVQALLLDVIQDPAVKELVSRSLAEVVTSSVVTDKAVELGKSITHEVVSDKKIQDETGDAMWKALKHSVTPGWFSN